MILINKIKRKKMKNETNQKIEMDNDFEYRAYLKHFNILSSQNTKSEITYKKGEEVKSYDPHGIF